MKSSEQKNEEVCSKRRESQKEMHAAPQEIDDKESLESGSTSARASMQASSTLPNDDKATFMGSITSKKYHSQDCRYALKIKQENRIYFQSIEDAKGQGYLPCKSCNP